MGATKCSDGFSLGTLREVPIFLRRQRLFWRFNGRTPPFEGLLIAKTQHLILRLVRFGASGGWFQVKSTGFYTNCLMLKCQGNYRRTAVTLETVLQLVTDCLFRHLFQRSSKSDCDWWFTDVRSYLTFFAVGIIIPYKNPPTRSSPTPYYIPTISLCY